LSIQLINIGAVPNDGTGDLLRDAFDKVNDNMIELYSAPVVNTSISVGNSTVNSFITGVSLRTGNTTVNSSVNTSTITITNTTSFSSLTQGQLTVANSTVVNSTSLFIGNSTVNAVHTAAQLSLANSITSFTATRNSVLIGNSTVNTTANSSQISTGSAVVSSNTLTLGTSSATANGYTYLPNGIKMNWGSVEANSTTGQVVFTNAFATSIFSISIAGNSVAHATRVPAVTSQNTTVAEIRTTNTSLTTVYYIAIGV
jgi:hypothetical protein